MFGSRHRARRRLRSLARGRPRPPPSPRVRIPRTAACAYLTNARNRIGTGARNARSPRSLCLTRRVRTGRRSLSLARLLATTMRGTGLEPRGLRFARKFVQCAGPDSNRKQMCSLASLAARNCQGSNPHFAFSAHGVVRGECAGPDSNRRTPTGQRPKRCAVGLAWLPALTTEFSRTE